MQHQCATISSETYQKALLCSLQIVIIFTSAAVLLGLGMQGKNEVLIASVPAIALLRLDIVD
jgi:hypothetical protein